MIIYSYSSSFYSAVIFAFTLCKLYKRNNGTLSP